MQDQAEPKPLKGNVVVPRASLGIWKTSCCPVIQQSPCNSDYCHRFGRYGHPNDVVNIKTKGSRWWTTGVGHPLAGGQSYMAGNFFYSLQLCPEEGIPRFTEAREMGKELPGGNLPREKQEAEKWLSGSACSTAHLVTFLGRPQDIPPRLESDRIWALPIYPMWCMPWQSCSHTAATPILVCQKNSMSTMSLPWSLELGVSDSPELACIQGNHPELQLEFVQRKFCRGNLFLKYLDLWIFRVPWNPEHFLNQIPFLKIERENSTCGFNLLLSPLGCTALASKCHLFLVRFCWEHASKWTNDWAGEQPLNNDQGDKEGKRQLRTSK